LHAALRLNTRGGFQKEVRQRLQEIIELYPDTSSAKQAQRQLEKMKK
jgi:TolA-binding protein